jgi:hypothetical protein
VTFGCRSIVLLCVAGAVTLESPAASADDKADCIAAFDAGQTLRADRKLTEAIPKLAICARDVCPHSLQRQCVEQAREASAQLPTIVLSAKDSRGSPLVDVKVVIDGSVAATTLDGKAVPIDPGLHRFVFERAGALPVTRQSVVNEGQKDQPIAVEFGAKEPPPRPPPPAPAAPASQTLRYVGVGVGVLGVASIALGSAFGVLAFNKWSQAKSDCDGLGCNAAVADRRSGETDGTISTAAFVAGGVLVAGGVVLFLVRPSHRSQPSAALHPTLGGLALEGRF